MIYAFLETFVQNLTLIHAQFALLDLPFTPQQKSFKYARSILRKRISPILQTSHSISFKQILIPLSTSFLSLLTTSKSLIFTWKIPRSSGNPKKLLSISATHTLCHQAPKAAGLSPCSFRFQSSFTAAFYSSEY